MRKVTDTLVLIILLWSFFLLPTVAQETTEESTSSIDTPSEELIDFSEENEDEETKVAQEETFGVPLPIVGASPNGGTTLGFLLSVVTEKEGRLSSIITPLATSNDLLGFGLDVNYFGFPTDDISFELVLGHTSKNYWDYSFEYEQSRFFEDYFSFKGEFLFERSPENRFYGIGPETQEDDESTYVSREVYGSMSLTSRIAENLFGIVTVKGRKVVIRRGEIDEVDSTQDVFSNIEGVVKGGYELPLQAALEYNGLDDNVSPVRGFFARGYFEIADRNILSSFDIRRYGAEVKAFFPFGEEARFVTAVRALVDLTDGKDVPFFALSSLGGDDSLRGFGKGRFYDDHRILASAEERIRLFRFPAGDINVDIESALFVDVGQVFSKFNEIKPGDIQVVFGAGARFVVRSQIVAKVDIGFGEDGNAVFAGLDYPF